MNRFQKLALLSYKDGAYQHLSGAEDVLAVNDPLLALIYFRAGKEGDLIHDMSLWIPEIEKIMFSIENVMRA